MTLQDLIKYFRKKVINGENPGSQAETAYKLYNNAILLVKFGRLEEAKRDLKEAVKKVPGFDDAYALLGLTHFALGNRIESIKAINQISDGAKHNQAMRMYDMLDRDSGENVDGTFKGAGSGEDETEAEQPERITEDIDTDETYAGSPDSYEDTRDYGEYEVPEEPVKRPAPSAPERAGVSDVIFELDEGVDFSRSDNAGKDASKKFKSDFKKRFEQAQKNAEAGRNVAQSNRQTDYESGRADAASDGYSTRTRRTEIERPAPQRPEMYVEEEDEPAPAPVQEYDDTDTYEAEQGEYKDENSEEENTASEPMPKNKKLLMRVLICIICISLVAAVAALAVKLHGNYVDRNKPAPTADPNVTPTVDPDTTDTPKPTATPAPATAEPTEAPTEVPTEAPKTDAELAAEQTRILAEVKALFDKGDYYNCYKLIYETEWTHINRTQTVEKDDMKDRSLLGFSHNYKDQMYKAVAAEDWQKVLDYAEAVIRFNPDWSEGAAIYFHAGKAAELLGDKEKAISYYSITMSKYPTSEDAKYADYRWSLLKLNG